jgi:tetratricopeptide (TPR) repeat protein
MKSTFILLSILSLFSFPSISQGTDSAQYFFQQGATARQERRFAVAEKNFLASLKRDPANINVRTALAANYFDLRKYDNALKTYMELYEKEPKNAAFVEQVSLLSFMMHKWEDAIRFTMMAKTMGVGKDHNYMLGKSYYETEDYGQAIRYLDGALKEAHPKQAECAYSIAHAYVEMSNYKVSLPYFEKAISLDTTQYGWVYELAMVYTSINDNKNAIRYMELAADRGMKRDNDYYENLSYAYMNAGQIDKAIEKLLVILQKKPSDITILYAVAEAYYYSKKYKDAIEYWDQVLYYEKDNYRALYMIGMAYQKKGDKAKGMQLCDRAIELDPGLASLKQEKSFNGIGL